MKTIVKRKLDYVNGAGRNKASVRVFEPKREGNAWLCQYRLAWPGYKRTFGIMGGDEWQALRLAMNIVPSAIFATPDFKQGRIGVSGHMFGTYKDICEAFGVKPAEGPSQQ